MQRHKESAPGAECDGPSQMRVTADSRESAGFNLSRFEGDKLREPKQTVRAVCPNPPRVVEGATTSSTLVSNVHTDQRLWKAGDPGVYGLALHIAALSTDEILEQYRLIRNLPEQLAYAAYTRRRILWRELMSRWIAVAP